MKVKSYNSITEILSEIEAKENERSRKRTIIFSFLFVMAVILAAGLMR